MISRARYNELLRERNSRFPETNARDAMHAWLVPVKAESDKLAVESLLKRGILDEHFELAVLSIDKGDPVTSPARCGLLQLIPEASSGWRTRFEKNLTASSLAGAKELLENLKEKSVRDLKNEAQQWLYVWRDKTQTKEGLNEAFTNMIARRQRVFENEISKNPLGQILEPGFRVIFPVAK